MDKSQITGEPQRETEKPIDSFLMHPISAPLPEDLNEIRNLPTGLRSLMEFFV